MSQPRADRLTRRHWWWSLAAILVAGALVRGIFLTADPPWQSTVGITWHDEGPWVHNARNKALFGHWSLDQWNPMYLSPVFTGLEWASFSAFGVGTWQARLVPWAWASPRWWCWPSELAHWPAAVPRSSARRCWRRTTSM